MGRGDIYRLFEESKKFAESSYKELKGGEQPKAKIGDGILISYMAKISLNDLEQLRYQLNRIIKKKKEMLRVKYNAGNVDKLVDIAVNDSNQKPGKC